MAKVKETDRPLPGVYQSRIALQFEYFVHHCGFYLLLLIIIAALGGVFSGGYVSEARKSNTSQSLNVEYQLFGRWQTPQHMKITVHGPPGERQIVRIGRDYMAHFETSNIWPQPEKMYTEGTDLVLVYPADNSRQGVTLWLYTTPGTPGKAITTVRLNNEPGVTFWQFVYP